MSKNKLKLEKICTFFNGRTKPNSKGRFPVYGGNGIISYINHYNADNILVIGRVGAYCGNVFYSRNKCWVSDNAIGIILNENVSNIKYIFYFLGKTNIRNLAIGSSQPLITQDILKNIEIDLPSLEEQKRIADILTALDDKIELNNQMNQTLEEIASLLYKRWFIDFEFPDDKGNPYKSSGGEMVDSELGMIPKRWEVKELGEICVNSDSKRKPLSKNQRERLSGDYPYYGATSIIDYVNDYIFDGTYLLVGEDGTVVTKDGKPILQYITGKIWVNNHAHVLQGKDVSTGFLFCKLSQFDVTHLVTGAVQMKITQSNLNKIKFVISESNIQKRFEKIITLLFNKRNENKIYNEALKKIKKELVIKLI